MALRRDLAEAAIRERVAKPLGLSLEAAAHGILRVVNARMAKGIAARTVQRGYDLREFSLLAFGGAGPLHAAELADDLGMRRAVVPPFPGAFSAFGLLVADTRHDFSRTVMRGADGLDPAWLTEAFLELERKAEAELDADGIGPERRRRVWSADLRFEGQSYELNVPVPRRTPLGPEDVAAMVGDFAALHERIYAFKAVDEKTVLVKGGVRGGGVARGGGVPRPPRGAGGAPRPAKGTRPVGFGAAGTLTARIHERRSLGTGDLVEGPAVVEEEISCTVVPPGWIATVDAVGNLVVERAAPAPEGRSR